MVDALRASTQGISKRFRCVKNIGLTHQSRHLSVQMLLLLGNLLHVIAFTPGCFVAIDVVKADTIARCSQRTGHGLKRSGADGGHYSTRLLPCPGQSRASMRHFDFIAEVENLRHAS